MWLKEVDRSNTSEQRQKGRETWSVGINIFELTAKKNNNNFYTFERQILYFSLHYIFIKVLKVESRYYVAALKIGGWLSFFPL